MVFYLLRRDALGETEALYAGKIGIDLEVVEVRPPLAALDGVRGGEESRGATQDLFVGERCDR
jgi:hypothetical protein